MEKKKKSFTETRIKTVLPLVYISADNKIEVLPYLDILRKDEVWGIQSGDCLWKKTHEAQSEWSDARKAARRNNIGNIKCALGPSSALIKAAEQKEAFRQTADILRQNGISAEEWREKEWYWTSESVCLYWGLIYMMYRNETISVGKKAGLFQTRLLLIE